MLDVLPPHGYDRSEPACSGGSYLSKIIYCFKEVSYFFMIKECAICEEEFNLNSAEKRRVGGLSIHCPSCSEERVVKYAGVQAADGKQSQATILKFQSESDRTKYLNFWQNNSGLHKGKSCQLGSHLSTTPNISFETKISFNPTNHKGKSL